jgi:hypothetical protein
MMIMMDGGRQRVQFNTPACMYVSGNSQVGKSHFVRRLIKERSGMFTDKIERVVYCYTILEEELVNMTEDDSNIILNEGLPNKQMIDDWSTEGPWILVLDDMMGQAVESKDVNYLFTIGCHHKRVTVIVMSHNLYTQGKQSRTISLNSNYFIIFQNRRDLGQVQTFGRQVYPGKVKFFVAAFEKCVSRAYGYMTVDLDPMSSALEQYRLRTQIFPNQDMIVFTPID